MCHVSRGIIRAPGTATTRAATASNTSTGGHSATNERVTPGPSRVADADLVALGIVHHDPIEAVLGELLDPGRTQVDEPGRLTFYIGSDDHVEVDPVLHDLRLGN